MPRFEIGDLVLGPISRYGGIDVVTGITIDKNNQVKYTIDNGSAVREEYEYNLKPYERKVKFPAIYLHFKNKLYVTMGVSKPATREFLKELVEKDCELLWTMYSESLNTKIYVYKYDGQYYHNDSRNVDLVLYKSLYDDTAIYTRDYDMFLSKVDKLKYPDVEQEYRFELIK